jgi:hypothetical protein
MTESQKYRPDFTRLIVRFPDHSDQIRALLLRDPTFRQLCEEYLLLLFTMTGFETRLPPVPHAHRQDYVQLCAELEVEIRRFLHRSADRGVTSNSTSTNAVAGRIGD